MDDHPKRLCYCGVFALTLSKTVKEGEESHIALLCIFFLTTLEDYVMFLLLSLKKENGQHSHFDSRDICFHYFLFCF